LLHRGRHRRLDGIGASRRLSPALFGARELPLECDDAFRRRCRRSVIGRGLREAGLELAVCVAVASDEGPPELEESADLVVEGTAGLLALLHRL
jgi:hypothetical protein